jgi:hypothetical protein
MAPWISTGGTRVQTSLAEVAVPGVKKGSLCHCPGLGILRLFRCVCIRPGREPALIELG